MASASIPIIARARRYQDRIAIIDPDGVHTYRELLNASGRVTAKLLNGSSDLLEARVAFLTPPNFSYVAIQWGIWGAGGVAVPLATMYPQPELEHVIDDSNASVLIAHPQYESLLRPIAEARRLQFLLTTELFAGTINAAVLVDPDRRAMIVYTSGTTGKPKGSVTTHFNIRSQVEALVSAWEWGVDDHILNVLPLHHVHGIINVLTCALWSGATCEMLPEFNPERVWDRLLEGGPTLFMAVPTIYARMATTWEAAPGPRQKALSNACGSVRLMVSGSAALPLPVLEHWHRISGHVLLERYGMTEIGMALSNPLRGRRRPGFVGTPLEGVLTRVVDESGIDVPQNTPGELLVKGPGVFLEYWRNPNATREAFRDGWFRTGDIVAIEDGAFRILGRNNVDIIKTGGFKVSALEVESVLLGHPSIIECAVVGIEDEEWGERVCAAVILRNEFSSDPRALRDWMKTQLATYKAPSRIKLVDQLPRNAMGKVLKAQVVPLFQREE